MKFFFRKIYKKFLQNREDKFKFFKPLFENYFILFYPIKLSKIHERTYHKV